MKIEHIAIYTKDLEKSRAFYEKYFFAVSGDKYTEGNGFESYFLKLKGDSRIEIMTNTNLADFPLPRDTAFVGIVHFAISVGSESEVDKLTARIMRDGFHMVSPPRRTGDGYYESCVLDPDGNRIEITV